MIVAYRLIHEQTVRCEQCGNEIVVRTERKLRADRKYCSFTCRKLASIIKKSRLKNMH